MRLPLSFIYRPSTHVFWILAFALLATMLSLSTPAAAQQLVCTPSALQFGGVVIGHSETEVVMLTNRGSKSITVSAMSTSGHESNEFNVSPLRLPLSLAAGQSVPINVTFAPTSTGWAQGQTIFTSNASNPALGLEFSGGGGTRASLRANPASVSFGQTALGATTTQSVTLTNLNPWRTKIDSLQLAGTGFSVSGPTMPFMLGVGQTVTVRLSFAPKSAGTSSGYMLTLGPSLTVPLIGTGTTSATAGTLSIAPTSLSFGNVSVGSTGTHAITMSATGASVMVSSDVSSNSQFALQGVSLPLTIPAGQSVSAQLAFTPTGSGTVSGSMSLSSNASDPKLSVALSGTGTSTAAGKLSITPTSLNFGDVNVGSTGSQAITMSASGASVTVSSDASSNSQFGLEGASLPFTIGAGQSASFNVGFTPKGSGTISGSLSFASNASNSPAVESLAGIGTTPQFKVDLSWNASTGVAGYNVYRSTSPTGTYTKINPALDANTAYTDASVASGQTYYYEATAVNSSGQESARSSPPVSASIP